MKKSLIILSSCIPLLLAGCSSLSTPSDGVSTGTLVPKTNLLNVITEKHTCSGVIEAGIYYMASGGFLRNCKELPENEKDFGSDYSCEEVSYYTHIYTIPSLGIKINLTDSPCVDWVDSFGYFEENPNFFTVEGNTLYSTEDRSFFIRKIEKNPNQNIESFIKTLPVLSGCRLKNREPIDSMSGLIIYNYESTTGASCDDEQSSAPTNFIFSATNPEYYYEEHYGNDCAPGICNALGMDKKLFVK